MPILQNNISSLQDTGGNLVQVPDATTADNLFVYAGSGTTKWKRQLEGKTYKASYFVNGVNDATAAITTALASSAVTVLIIDKPVTISGTLTIPSSKVLKFEQGGYLTGTATLNGSGVFEASLRQFCFDTNITVSGILPYKNRVSPIMWGAVVNGTTNDGPSCDRLFRYMETLSSKFPDVIYPAGTYLVNTTINLPYIAGTKSTFLNLKGYGAELKTTADIVIFNRLALTQTDAGSLFGSYRAIIEGFYFTGNSTVGGANTQQSAMKLGVLYGWILKNMDINQMRVGLDIQFSLKSKFDNIFFTNCAYIGMMGRHGQWTGASTSNAAFNINTITNCRWFNPSGAFTSLYLYATNMNVVRDCVSEGFNPQYNFYMDWGLSTVVNTNLFENIWIESTGGTYANNTIYYLDCVNTVIIRNTLRTYPNRIFEVGTTGGSLNLIIDGIPYLGNPPVAPLTWFAKGVLSNGASTVTFLNNLSLNTVFQTPSSWDGGTLPARIEVVGPDGIFSAQTLYSISAVRYQLSSHFLQLNDDTYALGVDKPLYVNQTVNYGRPKSILAGTYGVAVAPSTGKFRWEDASAAADVALSRFAANVLRVEATGGMVDPKGTTAQRPAHSAGLRRYNTDNNNYEYSNGSTWVTMASTSGALGIVSISFTDSPYTITTANRTILVDTSAGNVILNITPSAVNGYEFVVKKISSDTTNSVTITPASGTIDGDVNNTVTTQYETRTFQSNGTNLYITG